tara:strand:- start:1746 stop:2510 length:765 start_codon:yes stop_codon:yes gene_type:complete
MHKHKKSLGQNFLVDKNIINKIIHQVSPLYSDSFLEIGPGEGALTYPLVDKISELIVIEKDKKLSHKLGELFSKNNKITIINQDVLKIDIDKYIKNRVRVIGNLPYNIATEIIFFLLNSKIKILDIHVMLQKEMVDRISAPPGNKQYGRISVMIQANYNVKKLFDVSPNVFEPKPKVWSSYMRLTPKNNVFINDVHKENFKKIVTLAFVSRRKMIKTSLKDSITLDKILHIIGDERIRPEQLSYSQFIEMAKHA